MADASTTLDTTVGGTDSSSYITLDEADHYHANHRNSNTEWDAATDLEKSRAILWAMGLIETRFRWNGVKASAANSLEWPRYYAFDSNGYLYGYDYTAQEYIIPQKLKDAVAELAYVLIVKDTTAELSSKGLKGLTVDVIKLEFDSSDEPKTIPQNVLGLLTGLGAYKGPGAGQVSLVRT